ncbi:MAG: hypothetical protein IH597_16170 [Bacteroidales bacterium]|nr:hypothetical protein [Bacteroidales bacterium]
MKTILCILTFGFILSLWSCKHTQTVQKNIEGKQPLKTEFKNEGEHSEYMIRDVFENKYHEQSYPKYNGKIKIITRENMTSIIYDSIAISIGEYNLNYLGLFSSGLITPQMLGCSTSEGLAISITELKYLEKKDKRRFEFWVGPPNSFVTQSFLIELTNKEKLETDNFNEFIKNAKVTFVYEGWMIL